MTRYAVIDGQDEMTIVDEKPSDETIAEQMVVALDDEEGGSFCLLSSDEPTEFWFLSSLDTLVDEAREARQSRDEEVAL
jgi:hypothetical protein